MMDIVVSYVCFLIKKIICKALWSAGVVFKCAIQINVDFDLI